MTMPFWFNRPSNNARHVVTVPTSQNNLAVVIGTTNVRNQRLMRMWLQERGSFKAPSESEWDDRVFDHGVGYECPVETGRDIVTKEVWAFHLYRLTIR